MKEWKKRSQAIRWQLKRGKSKAYFLKLNRDGTGRAMTRGTAGSGAIGVGGVGRWAPSALNPFSSAI